MQRLSFDDFFNNEWVLQGKCKMIEDENMTDLQYQLKSVYQEAQKNLPPPHPSQSVLSQNFHNDLILFCHSKIVQMKTKIQLFLSHLKLITNSPYCQENLPQHFCLLMVIVTLDKIKNFLSQTMTLCPQTSPESFTLAQILPEKLIQDLKLQFKSLYLSINHITQPKNLLSDSRQQILLVHNKTDSKILKNYDSEPQNEVLETKTPANDP